MKSDFKPLVRRYLVWAYKSTKEAHDRLERKTTQLMVDDYIWQALSKKPAPKGPEREAYTAKLGEFKQYIADKKARALPAGEYRYLSDRLQAVEGAIKYFLGVGELRRIRAAYEKEFIRRIWESKEH